MTKRKSTTKKRKPTKRKRFPAVLITGKAYDALVRSAERLGLVESFRGDDGEIQYRDTRKTGSLRSLMQLLDRDLDG